MERQIGRVRAHILVCFLALALWRGLEQWGASKGLGNCARRLLKELEELHSVEVVLPADSGVELRLRVVVPPEKELAQLLGRRGLGLPQRPKVLRHVAPENGSKTLFVPANQPRRFFDCRTWIRG